MVWLRAALYLQLQSPTPLHAPSSVRIVWGQCARLVLRRSVFLVMYCHYEGSLGSVLACQLSLHKKMDLGPAAGIRKAATIRRHMQRTLCACHQSHNPKSSPIWRVCHLSTGVHVPSNCDPLSVCLIYIYIYICIHMIYGTLIQRRTAKQSPNGTSRQP